MKHFSKIFINTIVYISIAMILLAVFMSGILNRIIEKRYLDMMQTNNQMLFEQLAYQVSYIHETNLAFLDMEFNDSEIQSLMTEESSQDMFSYIQVFQQIQKDMSANDMIDSVMLYNGKIDQHYYTDYMLWQDDEEIVDFLRSNKKNGLNVVLSRVIHTTEERPVLSYVMVSRNPKDNSVEYGVVVNVKKEKMMEQLQKNHTTGGYILLADHDGNIILNTGKEKSSRLEENITQYMKEGDNSIFVEEIDGKKQVVNIQSIEGTECSLLAIQDYDTAFGMISEIKNQIILVVVAVLGITFLLTVLVTKKVMEPLSALMIQVKERYGGDEKKKEFELLSEVIERQESLLSQYGNYEEHTQNILHKMKMKNILLENGTNVYPPAKIEEKASYDMFAKGEHIYIVLLSVANFHKLNKQDVAERNLIRFVVCNIAEELMQQYGRVEVIPVTGGDVVLLLGREEQDAELCRNLLWDVEENVRKVVDITLSVFADEIVYGREALASAYKKLQKMKKYTLVYGNGCVLFGSEVDVEGRKNLEYPQEIETEIIGAINDGKAEKMDTAIKKFLDYLKQGRIESYIACVHKFVLSLQTNISHVNQHRLIKVQVDFESVLQETLETEEQVYQMLCNLGRNIIEQMPSNVNKKNETMVYKIKEYIEMHYAEKELCSKQVAAEFGMSTGYMGMLFKEFSGSSIQEYINQVRLEHAGELVLHTDLLISEVMEKCGFETSSFYRLYKNYFGTSPKEHRMKQRLEEK